MRQEQIHSKTNIRQVCESPLRCGRKAVVFNTNQRQYLCKECQTILTAYLTDDEMGYRKCA